MGKQEKSETVTLRLPAKLAAAFAQILEDESKKVRGNATSPFAHVQVNKSAVYLAALELGLPLLQEKLQGLYTRIHENVYTRIHENRDTGIHASASTEIPVHRGTPDVELPEGGEGELVVEPDAGLEEYDFLKTL